MEQILLNFYCSDSVVVEVNFKALAYLKNFHSIFALSADQLMTLSKQMIPINFPSSIFNIVIRWCNFRSKKDLGSIQRPFGFKKFEEIVSDSEVIEMISKLDLNTLVGVINACEALVCEELLEVCLARIAVYLRDTDIETLKSIFQIESFTKEDYDNIIKGNPWLMQMNEDRLNELAN